MKGTDEKTKKRIERELSNVNRDIEALKLEPREEELEGLGDNTPLSEEVDAALAIEERELRAGRLSRLLDRAAALDEALHRLHAGVYGICIACNEAISRPRLRAVPEALLCTRCQEDAERTRRREIHAHEWKLAEETFRERRKAEEGESAAAPGAIGIEADSSG
jgi:RNA polymerase-binding transcription factor DksA